MTIDDDDEMEPELGADAVAIKIHDRERTPSRGYRKDPVNSNRSGRPGHVLL